MATPYAPGTLETDPKKQNIALQQHASAINTNTTNIATNTSNISTIQTTLSNLAASVTNSLAADVDLTDNNYHDGPSCAQGTSGKWLAIGTVTLVDLSGTASFVGKLWDGTTVAASCAAYSAASGVYTTITLVGVISTPAANIRISVADSNGVPNGKIKADATGNSKDSTLTVIRIG
jgi:hypothetical protein